MTDSEYKVYRCREWMENGQQPTDTPHRLLTNKRSCSRVPDDGLGPFTPRTFNSSALLCNYPTNEIVAEARGISQSLLQP